MALRSIQFRPSALNELLQSPRGTVGQHFQKIAAKATREAKSLTSQKLQRGTGSGPHYADSFRTTVAVGPRGLRLVLENTSPIAAIIEKGSRPHVIRPRNAKVLRFEVKGETVWAREVHHPGTRAYRILEAAIRMAARAA